MFGRGVRDSELIIAEYMTGAVVTWADLLARTYIHILTSHALRSSIRQLYRLSSINDEGRRPAA
jgi:hypothetical protein